MNAYNSNYYKKGICKCYMMKIFKMNNYKLYPTSVLKGKKKNWILYEEVKEQQQKTYIIKHVVIRLPNMFPFPTFIELITLSNKELSNHKSVVSHSASKSKS